MPKYTLKRDNERKNFKGGLLRATFIGATSSGNKIIQTQSEEVSETKSSDLRSTHNGKLSLFETGFIETVFHQLTSDSPLRLPDGAEMVINESMDSMYRTGELSFVDYEGNVELLGLHNTYEEEFVEVNIKNKYEGDIGRSFKFGLYGVTVDAIDENTFIKGLRRNTFKLYEQPYFVNYHKHSLGESWKENTAMEIVTNILAEKMNIPNIKMVENDNKDPILPTFISPNWSPIKTIKYLMNYCAKGPMKVFNISKGRDTVTMQAPLEKFIKGEVYPNKLTIKPLVSETTDSSLRLGKFQVWGIKEGQELNFLRGNTTMSFDYFFGEESDHDSDFTDFPDENKSKYAYNKGTSRYELEKRSYGAHVSGKYDEGMKKVKNLGVHTAHIKETNSNIDHIYDLDVDPKPLIEAKQLNRFYQSYFDGFMLYTVLPHFSEVQVGQVFEIVLPHVNQPNNQKEGMRKDETLSGDWLLWKMQHKIKVVPSKEDTKGSQSKYELHCYFVKTSYEVSNRLKHEKNV